MALLYSVGHGRRPVDAFLELVQAPGIRRVVDVRAMPASRRNPHFNKATLDSVLADACIEYVWRGAELGGLRTPRPDSHHVALWNDALRGYADHTETREFADGLDWLLRSADEMPTAFMCAESDWRRCHRRILSDAIVATGGRVVHLLDGGGEEHVLHSSARGEDGRPIYDRRAQRSLL
ncbi:MAG TPA: DUF488 domain-containing protein [Actinomycetota bacterium]|jgi:uncharacterized protein (DUF488 family)|nr:DUF488 domain-containing protein [Actinomycetota bacterium]